MKTIPIICYLMIFLSNAMAQDQTFRVKAGNNVLDVLAKEIYDYPSFTDGIVKFKNGTAYGAKLNYNKLYAEIQFIDQHGDTLSLANENTIAVVQLQNDSFFYDNGYIKFIGGNEVIKLAMKEILKLSQTQKIGGYGQPTTGTSVDSYGSFDNGRQMVKLSLNEDKIFSKRRGYYFGDRYYHFLPANKKNLFAMFPKNETAIKNYLKDNLVDFNKREDLDKLMVFLQTL